MKPIKSGVVTFSHPNELPGDFGETCRLDLCWNVTNVTDVLITGYKCFISSVAFLSLSNGCKRYANLLENERQLSNRDFAFLAVYFSAQLDCTAA